MFNQKLTLTRVGFKPTSVHIIDYLYLSLQKYKTIIITQN